jgi:hypothetical protein
MNPDLSDLANSSIRLKIRNATDFMSAMLKRYSATTRLKIDLPFCCDY